jgi:hypothetical protein
MQYADGTSPITYTVTGSIAGRRVSMTSYTIKALVPEWTVTPDPLSSTNNRTGKITSTNSATSKMGVYYGERELARSDDEIAFAKVDLIVPPGPGPSGGTPLPEDRQPAGGTAPATNELNPGTVVLLYGEDQTNRVATTLTLKADPTGGSVTLDQHGLTDLKIYNDGVLQEELTLPKTWTNGETSPTTLYMVGSSSFTNLQSAQGTLDLTYKANLAANGGEYSIEDTVGVNLLPIDIKEVASDQINDSDCNKLPTAKYAGEPNNPMLMATRTGVRAHLAIKVESPEGFRDKIYVGARKVGATTILGSVTVKAPNEKTKLEFDAIPGHEIYEVVAGYDQNGNAALDSDEAQIVFKKTPAGSATSGLQYLDKIIIVTESQFGASKGTVAGYNVWGTGYAGDLIEGFSKGSATISGATTANNVDISANEPGLSHPVGGRWNPGCKDKTYRFTFADASSASNDFEGSNAFEQIVEKVLRDNIAALVAAYDGSVEWAVSSPYTFNESKNLIETEAVFIGFNKLGLAFGKVDIGGTIRFSYKKTGPNSITVGSVEVIGNFDDLYDFAYGGGDQARQASMIQAGHATLAKAPEANAGKVFFTRLEFNSGWKNWNRNYTNP